MYIGIDLGGTNIAVGIVDENNVDHRKGFPSDARSVLGRRILRCDSRCMQRCTGKGRPDPRRCTVDSASAARAPLTVLPASLNLLTTSISRTSSSAT